MTDRVRKMSPKGGGLPKVAVACQGGGMHAGFEIGVLTEILEDINERKRFELVGVSGTSAGALCALMVWYGLVPKVGGSRGSVPEAIDKLNRFWDDYVAKTGAETLLNLFTYGALRAEETEIPVLGVNAPIPFGLNPYGMISKAVAACLPRLGARKQYFDLDYMLAKACPDFGKIDWQEVKTRLLIGASEVNKGAEAVFDSDCNMAAYGKKICRSQSGPPLAPAIAAHLVGGRRLRNVARILRGRAYRWWLLLGRSLLTESTSARVPCGNGRGA